MDFDMNLDEEDEVSSYFKTQHRPNSQNENLNKTSNTVNNMFPTSIDPHLNFNPNDDYMPDGEDMSDCDDPIDVIQRSNTRDHSSTQTITTASLNELMENLKALYGLDDHHYQMAVSSSQCDEAERHTRTMFALTALLQRSSSNPTPQLPFSFTNTIKDFIRVKAQMTLLNPTIQSYLELQDGSGNTLPKSLYQICQEAVQNQPREYKELHLAPGHLEEEPTAKAKFRALMGSLLKHERSHLRTLLLHNILTTKRQQIAGPVPKLTDMIMMIYEKLMPVDRKASMAEIRNRIHTNWSIRIRFAYLRLVMVQYYISKDNHPHRSQWAEIDRRLDYLRQQSIPFQQRHAQMVLQKDEELFSREWRYIDIPKGLFSVPSIEDVQASLNLPPLSAASNRSQNLNKHI